MHSNSRRINEIASRSASRFREAKVSCAFGGGCFFDKVSLTFSILRIDDDIVF